MKRKKKGKVVKNAGYNYIYIICSIICIVSIECVRYGTMAPFYNNYATFGFHMFVT